MKKILVFVFISILFLTACEFSEGKKEYFGYIEETIEYDNKIVLLDNFEENKGGEYYSVSFNLAFTNINPKIYNLEFSKIYIIREKNEAEYLVRSIVEISESLQCDMPRTLYLYSTIPTSVEKENYYLLFEENNNRVRINLYNKSIGQLKDITVEWNVYTDGKYLTYYATAKEGWSVLDYSWISKDGLYSSRKWYLDRERTIEVTNKTKAVDGMKLYGTKDVIFNTYQVSNVVHISRINYVPYCGKIVIPISMGGIDSITLDSISIVEDNNIRLRELHIPLNVKKINKDASEFFNKFDVIYYEGTYQEFHSLYPYELEVNDIHYQEYNK